MWRRRQVMSELATRIREEFEEAPGLAVTINQGARFWVLDAVTCEHVLTHLQTTGFLIKNADGHFKRRTSA